MGSLSDPVLVALIATFVPSLIAFLNFLQGRKIHVLVNSNMTKVQADLHIANQRIEALQQALAPELPNPSAPEPKETL